MTGLNRVEVTIGWHDHLNATCIDCHQDIRHFLREAVAINAIVTAARNHRCPQRQGPVSRALAWITHKAA